MLFKHLKFKYLKFAVVFLSQYVADLEFEQLAGLVPIIGIWVYAIYLQWYTLCLCKRRANMTYPLPLKGNSMTITHLHVYHIHAFDF